ncbi:hypothetical protein ACIBI9_32100 [Nonomuraea sp. NPDC050451]|uniref:hypothetical protein n=1 Tax=Nonomuraea sp. NPDC050451 TaxID=3364364 RepID=UPI003794DCC5
MYPRSTAPKTISGTENLRERPARFARLLVDHGAITGEDEGFVRRVLAVLDGLQTHWLLDPGAFSLGESWKRVAEVLLGPGQR